VLFSLSLPPKKGSIIQVFQKIISFVSKLVLLLAGLCIFAWAVWQANEGNGKLGFLEKPLATFATFPSLAMEVTKEIEKPERLLNYDPNFPNINTLDYDVYALNAAFETSEWKIRLANLRTDSVLLEWHLGEENYNNTGRVFSHAEPRSPILLSDRSIVIHNDESWNLFRLDEQSNILWHNTDHQYHHGINLDHEGNIWACTSNEVQMLKNKMIYRDNSITKIDVGTGDVLFHKSISEIFIENDMPYVLHGQANEVSRKGFDPLHLNEVEPVLNDGTHWKKGDLFISLRDRSMIFLYRPSTNEILKVIQGPFYNQHDIDVRSDSTVSLFNNNVTSLGKLDHPGERTRSDDHLLPNTTLNLNAQVLIYNFNSDTFTAVFPEKFIENNVYTATQGLHHFMANGDLFVESQEEGKIYLFNEGETSIKRYYNDPINNHIEHTHWIRIYEELDFIN